MPKICTKRKVLFVGAGPAYTLMTSRYKNEINDKKFIFTGFVEWINVHSFYQISDIFITESLFEMHSMTILEAQLSSLPIITRKDESYFDCIEDGINGYMCDTDEQMVNRIIELVEDKEKRLQFSKASLNTTKNFSIENYIKRTLFLYNEVIKNYPKKIDDIKVMQNMKKDIQ